MIEADKSQQAGDFPHVIEITDAILQQNPRDAAAFYLRGSAKVELGVRQGDAKLIRDGVADAREAIRYDSQRTAMYYLPYLHGMKNLAILENRKEHAETAVTIATQILGVNGISNDDKANLLFQRAQSEGWLGKTDQAIGDFEEALKLVPTHFGARAALADLLASAGKNDQALAAYNKLVESFPESPLSYNNRGMFLQRQGKYDDAITDFTRAVERDPNYFYSYTNRGFTLLQMDNPTAAQVDFTQSLKLNPQQAFVYNLRGLAQLALGDLQGAIQDQRAAVEMNPKDPVARGDLGFLLSFAEDFAAATPEFDAALQIDPQFRYLNPWKIVALKRLGKSDDLKAQYSDSLNKDLEAARLGRSSRRLSAGSRNRGQPARRGERSEGSAQERRTVRGRVFHRRDQGGGRQYGRGAGSLSAGRRDKIPAALRLPRSTIRSEEGKSHPGHSGQRRRADHDRRQARAQLRQIERVSVPRCGEFVPAG